MSEDDLEFQLIDINHFHDDNDEYKIRLFGKTKEDKSVYLEVNGFRPYFFVEIPENWREWHVRKVMNHVKEKVWPADKAGGLINYEVVKKHKFYYFSNFKKFTFLKLEFNNYDSMRAYARQFTKKMYIPGISRRKKEKFNLYESNIAPFIRFLHIRDINSVGWCKVKAANLTKFAGYQKPSETDLAYRTRWNDVDPVKSSDIHRFTIMSFDLECTSSDGGFPQAHRPEDEIIQIGMTYSRCGESQCFKKIILCLKDTDDIKGSDVRCFDSEADLLLEFSKLIRETDPDIVTGYNIYGFDFPYLEKRASLLGIGTKFSRLSRLKNHICQFEKKELQSSALGFNSINYYDMPGRVSIDLMKVIQRDHKLPMYKLDAVASTFIKEQIIKYQNKKKYTKLIVNSSYGIKVGQYVNIYYNDRITNNKISNKKYKVLKIGSYKDESGKEYKFINVDDPNMEAKKYLGCKYKLYICQAKDDVKASDIFKFYRGTSRQRMIVAKYCLKDCELCNMLISKLAVIINNIGMANVCHVPLSYLFLRGQGVKIFSLVSKVCREHNHLIPVLKKNNNKKKEEEKKDNMTPQEKKYMQRIEKYAAYGNDNDDSDEEDEEDETYEGATVFKPDKPRAFFDPIPVLDFNSLYPNSMRLRGLSHEMLVKDAKYMNLPGYKYNTITYKNGKGEDVNDTFAERLDGKKGIIPIILQYLLDTRSIYKKKKENAETSFMASVFDGLQLAYKVTANSLYGQTGAPTSPIYMKEIAASTTAIGREMLQFAKDFVEGMYADILRIGNSKKKKPFMRYMKEAFKDVSDEKILNVKKNNSRDKKHILWKNRKEFFKWVKEQVYSNLKGFTTDPTIIYGDTDSVFGRLNIRDKKTKELLKDKSSLIKAINLGNLCEVLVNLHLDHPMYLEYEKVLWPFAILTKKRYVGNLYENNPDKFVQKSMGIVTKRRDNADIVKDVVGGIIDIILNDRDPIKAGMFVQNILEKIIKGKFSVEKFIITKTLKPKEQYKNWKTQPHVALGDRIAKRDPGNAPLPNERLPFIYVETGKKKVKLQGDRVEHPDFIMENNLRVDYSFYITNQIMKPAIQFLDLILIPGIAQSVFDDYLIMEENRKNNVKAIAYHFDNYKESEGLSIDMSGSEDDNGTSAESDNISKHSKSIKRKQSKKSKKKVKNKSKKPKKTQKNPFIHGIIETRKTKPEPKAVKKDYRGDFADSVSADEDSDGFGLGMDSDIMESE